MIDHSDMPPGLQVEAEVLESCVRRGCHDADELRRGSLLESGHCHVPAAVSQSEIKGPYTDNIPYAMVGLG